MESKLRDVDKIIEYIFSDTPENLIDNKMVFVTIRHLYNYRKFNSLPDRDVISPLLEADPDKPDVYEVDLFPLLLKINSENNKVINSNEKKVINLILLGSEESIDSKQILYCDPEKNPILYSYFESLKKDHAKRANIIPIPYFPGRSFTRSQLWELGKEYGYCKSSINRALKGLVEKNLVESELVFKDKQNKNDRFKVSVSGCNRYLNNLKILK
ncbi:MAG: hypothetical protein K6E72_04015 [Saccharofermentans sp.]|nr:hypothetical protein [Saccharofermentans sp.]